MSVRAFLASVEGDDAARTIVMGRLAGTCGTDLHEVALASFDGDQPFSQPHGERYFRAGTGNQALVLELATSLDDVRTGHAVDAIEHDEAGVTVRVGPHAEHADAVIIAVPAPIASRLAVTPALPDDLASGLAGLRMGVASKFAVATKERPPVRSRQAADLSMWCWTSNGADGRARRCVASFAGSPAACDSLGLNRGELTPWLEAVRSMNPDLTLVDEPVLYAWADDPYTARGVLELGPGFLDASGGVRAASRSNRVRGRAYSRRSPRHDGGCTAFGTASGGAGCFAARSRLIGLLAGRRNPSTRC